MSNFTSVFTIVSSVLIWLAVCYGAFRLLRAPSYLGPSSSSPQSVPVVHSVKVQEYLKPPPTVEFDPQNREHLIAFQMLRLPSPLSRQHPTLRFSFDNEKYDNAYQAMLESVASHYLLVSGVYDEAVSRANALAKQRAVKPQQLQVKRRKSSNKVSQLKVTNRKPSLKKEKKLNVITFESTGTSQD